jgi:hypothetical protein
MRAIMSAIGGKANIAGALQSLHYANDFGPTVCLSADSRLISAFTLSTSSARLAFTLLSSAFRLSISRLLASSLLPSAMATIFVGAAM